jgi:hypothetical protein
MAKSAKDDEEYDIPEPEQHRNIFEVKKICFYVYSKALRIHLFLRFTVCFGIAFHQLNLSFFERNAFIFVHVVFLARKPLFTGFEKEHL